MSKSAAATMPQSLSHHRSIALTWMMLLAITAITCVMVLPAQGQQKFEVKDYKKDWLVSPNFKRMRSSVVLDGSKLASSAGALKQGYENIFNAMTQPAEFKDIQARKAEVLKDLYNSGRTGNLAVAKFIRDIAFTRCEELAKGNYHPATRVNALLMLGELNDQEMVSLEKKPPVPMARALPVLLSYVEDPQTPDALHVAALYGVQRHALFNARRWNAADKDRVSAAMVKIAESPKPAAREAEAHGWVQNIAIDTLVSIGNPSTEAKLASIVFGAPTKPDASQQVLVHTAAISHGIKVPANFTVDTDGITKGWASHIAKVIGREAKRIEDFEKPRPKASAVTYGAASGYGGEEGFDEDMSYEEEGMYDSEEGGYGAMLLGAGTTEQTPEIKRARRMLNYMLESFHLGLTGTKTTVEGKAPTAGLVMMGDDAAKKLANDLLAVVDGAFTGVNDTTIGDNKDYAEKLRELENQFAAYVDPSASVEAPEVPVVGDNPFGLFGQ